MDDLPSLGTKFVDDSFAMGFGVCVEFFSAATHKNVHGYKPGQATTTTIDEWRSGDDSGEGNFESEKVRLLVLVRVAATGAGRDYQHNYVLPNEQTTRLFLDGALQTLLQF
jgi:hypothetical protein